MTTTLTPQEEANARNTKLENEAYFKHVGGVQTVLEKVGGVLHGAAEKVETLVGMKKHKESKELLNHGVIFGGAGNIRFDSVPYPKMELPWNKLPVNNGAIVKVLTSGICGSDLHFFQGHTTMKTGTVLGHEFTGEIVEIGPGVQHMKVGDWGAIPYNVACGTCPSCKEMHPEICERTNPDRNIYGVGGIYGAGACGGEWQGGQAEFAFVPFADYNFQRFEDKALAKSKLLDLALLSDVLPSAMHGTEEAQVTLGQTVYIAGAGPIGLCCAALSKLKGALHVIVSDFNLERLALARRQGCLTIDLNQIEDEKKLGVRLKELIGTQWVDCSIECVGYQGLGFGRKVPGASGAALQGCCELTKPGGRIGVLGAFFGGDPLAASEQEKAGYFPLPLASSWMKGHTLVGGLMIGTRYIAPLRKLILANKLPMASLLDVKVMPLSEAAKAYEEFRSGAPHKYIFDPHNTLGLHSTNTPTTTTTTQ